jgi:hypothetical protein
MMLNAVNAYSLIDEMEGLLLRNFHDGISRKHSRCEIWAEHIDECFLEVLSQLFLLGRLDQGLNQFISTFIKRQLRQAYDQLSKTRIGKTQNCRTYQYADVLCFVHQSQSLLQLLRQEIDQRGYKAA